MFYAQMPEDIRKHELKFIGFFTKRQTLYFAVSALIATPLGLWLGDILQFDLLSKCILIILLASPGIASSFYKESGLYGLKLIFRVVYFSFLVPKERKRVSKNVFRVQMEEYEKSIEKEACNNLSEKEKKELNKKKNAKKKIDYKSTGRDKIYHC